MHIADRSILAEGPVGMEPRLNYLDWKRHEVSKGQWQAYLTNKFSIIGYSNVGKQAVGHTKFYVPVAVAPRSSSAAA